MDHPRLLPSLARMHPPSEVDEAFDQHLTTVSKDCPLHSQGCRVDKPATVALSGDVDGEELMAQRAMLRLKVIEVHTAFSNRVQSQHAWDDLLALLPVSNRVLPLAIFIEGMPCVLPVEPRALGGLKKLIHLMPV